MSCRAKARRVQVASTLINRATFGQACRVGSPANSIFASCSGRELADSTLKHLQHTWR
jgi:hypothetical protein